MEILDCPAWEKPEDITVEKLMLNEVPVEKYINHTTSTAASDETLLMFHGGGYIVPIIDMYRHVVEAFIR